MKVVNVIASLPTHGWMLSNLFPPTEALFCLHKEQWMTPAMTDIVCCWEQELKEYIHRTEHLGILNLEIKKTAQKRNGKGRTGNKKIEIKICL